jgi:arabinogalactan oligomer/maltooligosaccharide transport system permease protein
MQKERHVSVGMVILGVLVALVGVGLWRVTRAWRFAPIFAILILLGLVVVWAGAFGRKRLREVAVQILAQLACITILLSVIFPVLWILGMSMDPRDILRPLDLSPITSIPQNLLRVVPDRFPLPEESSVWRLEGISAQDRTQNSVDVLGRYYELPEGWSKADLQRDDVWMIGRDLIEWKPVNPFSEDATQLVFPGQVTLLPDDVELDSLLPLESAVRPDGYISLRGERYAVPKGWSLRRVDRPTLWLLDSQLVYWGVLEPLPEGDLVDPLGAGEEPDCYLLLDEREGENQYTCPQGYRVETSEEVAYWLAEDQFGLCNGSKSSAISKEDLRDTGQSPAIWFQGRRIVDWRTSSMRAFASVFNRPTANPVGFTRLLLNSTLLAAGVSVFCILVGTTASYAFSRFQFPGRGAGMLGFVIVLMMPSVATLAPLFVILNAIQVPPTALQIILWVVGSAAGLAGILLILWNLIKKTEGWRWIVLPLLLIVVGVVLDLSAARSVAAGSAEPFILRNSLWGVGIAMVAGALPFSIWNMKGFIDTIPKELEEAALIDGASPTQTFFQIMLPLALPGLAVTALFGFIAGWTEFVLSWQFLTNPSNFTLAMALRGMQGQYSSETPWSNFAAMSILVSVPVTAVFFALQKYIVGGLTLGAVKG